MRKTGLAWIAALVFAGSGIIAIVAGCGMVKSSAYRDLKNEREDTTAALQGMTAALQGTKTDLAKEGEGSGPVRRTPAMAGKRDLATAVFGATRGTPLETPKRELARALPGEELWIIEKSSEPAVPSDPKAPAPVH